MSQALLHEGFIQMQEIRCMKYHRGRVKKGVTKLLSDPRVKG